MTIRNKIVMHFSAITAAILLLLGVFVYFFTQQHTEKEFYQRMLVRAGVAGKAMFEADSSNLSFYNEIRENHLQRLPEEKEYFFTSPAEASKSLNVQVPELFVQQLQAGEEVRFRKNKVHYVAIVYTYEKGSSTIVLSAVNRIGGELLSNLANNLLIGFLVAIGIVAFMSYLLAAEVVNPIRSIITDTRKITASNLHLRLPVGNGSAETADLAQTFNDMLDRLETSFETQANFLNKAAHELRTPLTAILGEAELALARQRSVEEYNAAFMVIAREAEQMRQLTSSLLELAQAGYNSKEPFMGDIRIDELLFSVKRLIDFSEPGNQVHINLDQLPEADEAITVLGNTNLLKLALANIIQNGSKYSGQQPVDVSLSTDGTHCVIVVRDRGIGIPEKELKYIFDPFFRASNTTPYKGYGVGLPLAQKIVRLHRGELQFQSRVHEGTTVKILLPLR